jgi:hypothetical protein
MLPVFFKPLGSRKASFSPFPTRYARSASANPFAFAAANLDALLLVSASDWAATALLAEGDEDAVVDGARAAADAPANRPAHSLGGARGASTFSDCASGWASCSEACAGSVFSTGFSAFVAGSTPFSLLVRGASRGAAFGSAGMKGRAGRAGTGPRKGLVGVTVAVVEEGAGCVELGVVGDVELPKSDR